MKRSASLIILIVVLSAFLVLVYPLLRFGIRGTFFYNLDPDIVYITNALLLGKTGTVFYFDHPGTPMISLLMFAYLPLRILHPNFLDWAFNNFTGLMYYSRFFCLILYCLGLYVFLRVIQKTYHSYLIMLAGFFAFFSIVRVERAILVAPETLAIFLTAIWLAFFEKFCRKAGYRTNTILVIISAFAVATKFTSLFLLISSLFLPIFIPKATRCQKICRIGTNILISVGIFFVGILPAFDRLGYLANWLMLLITHPAIYGVGAAALFSLKIYIDSVTNLIFGNQIPFALIISSVVLAIYLIKTKKIKRTDLHIFLLLTTLLGVIVFAKYPLIHYFIVNFVLIIYCLCYLLTKMNKKLVSIFLILMAISTVRGIKAYLPGGVFMYGPEIIAMQNYISENPAVKGTLWGCEVTNVYSELYSWTATYSGNVFVEQFFQKPVYILSCDLKYINIHGGNISKKDVLSVCWDKVYLLKKDVPTFIQLYDKNKCFDVNTIRGDDGILEISSNRCTRS